MIVLQASDDIRHMQKSLRQMNLLLDNVVGRSRYRGEKAPLTNASKM